MGRRPWLYAVLSAAVALAGCKKDSPEVVICGDGTTAGAEQCDCGLEYLYRPWNCSDINGGPNANCDVICRKIIVCGDGRVDDGEECDDGNLFVGDGCNAFCETEGTCTPKHEEECALQPIAGNCCEDVYGEQLACHGLSNSDSGWCLRECETTDDCYWDTRCQASLGGACNKAYCGPGTSMGGQSNTPCTVPGGGPGWCWPIFDRELADQQQWGYCVEAGSIPPGGACRDHWPLDRTEDVCDLGLCLEGGCLAFCEWEDAYETAMYDATPMSVLGACPHGTNCIGEATINVDTGLHENGFGLCRALVGTENLIGCSLVNSRLLSDPSRSCADLDLAGNQRCGLIVFTSGTVVNGSLIGICREGVAPNRGVWEECNAATDACPPGSECLEQDVFSASPQGPTVCVPYCDTHHPSGTQAPCADQGGVPTVDGTPVCTSLSQLYNPDDGFPTRLGYCALPP